ncbi:membrane protein [Klebsiella sp. RIT-PI-d]|uniref:DUF485 domain-containing protein n=1 Tax=Klebsiella sp. RIT-PI-d TaxID=1681196 RepID=UPI0006767FBC|nr:DUF485 domain-containing protein [Klebsiella sp. RIT-PI-d]KNC12969.1 membrane protein [Klebsiella sp. RIT-PI-d]
MNDTIYQRIESNAHFRELVEKRQRFAFMLSIIMLIIYVGFILLIAFAPGWLGTPLYAGTSVTRGIPVGIGVIVISFILTGVYVWRANSEFDRLNAAVIREVNQP